MGKMKELQIAKDNGYNTAFVLKCGRITYSIFSTDASIRRAARFRKAQIALRLDDEGGFPRPVTVYRADALTEKLRRLWDRCCQLT